MRVCGQNNCIIDPGFTAAGNATISVTCWTNLIGKTSLPLKEKLYLSTDYKVIKNKYFIFLVKDLYLFECIGALEATITHGGGFYQYRLISKS